MHASTPIPPKAGLTVARVLSQLLERLEQSKAPVAAEQYRSVVLHLVHEFGDIEPSDELRALLDKHPSAAQLYENVNYRHAGLCRSPLDLAMAAELQAKQVIEGAMRGLKSGSASDNQG